MASSMRTDGPDVLGCLAALAGLELMTISRLRVLLAHHDPADAYEVATGRRPAHPMVERMMQGQVRAAWRASADRRSPSEWGARCRRDDISAVTMRDDDYPPVLRHDPEPPAVLFVRGRLDVLDARRVGVVGTRNATRAGRATATALGRGLAAEGVVVVSGLAKGIDAGAHHGALSVVAAGAAPPVAVVGNGLDTPYPRVNARLWDEVARHGLLLSEWPPGTAPEAFRFPLRNRILAALSEIVVVVESRERGGSLITATAAMERGIDVMAVPGSVNSRAALGVNQLLRDGAAPVTSAQDVLLALGLDNRRSGRSDFDPRPLPRGVEAAVLERCRRDPCTLDEVVVDLQLPLAEAAMTLARLERTGWLHEAGGWFEAVVDWPDAPSHPPAVYR
ncbi:MAG: DNA-processing protein DprA [Ilumatobacteraceae bacterium]